MPERIGFVSTRFAGNDGVSLESEKWAHVLADYGHQSFWFAGRLDRPPESCMCVPEAFFGHAANLSLNKQIWGRTNRSPEVSRRAHLMAEFIKGRLYEFVQRFDLTILVAENCLTIPMHLPLGLALTEFLSETRIPAIAHHHDFYWERDRFSVNGIVDFLDMAFPPRDPDIQHVVINHKAQEDLSWRKGVSSMLVPNVLDFENPPPAPDPWSADVRKQIGLSPDDIMILQPTRVVPRKGIEHAIKLVQLLDDPRCKLIISHESGDEGEDYCNMLVEHARESNVDLRFIDTRIGDRRQYNSRGQKIYTLWDVYLHADLITYPSLYEGFGNALLEAFYFRKPALINRYSIFVRDIEPKGFDVLLMDGFITRSTVEKVREMLSDDAKRQASVDHNYNLAKRFYSYSVLRRSLRTLVTNITGLPELWDTCEIPD